MTVGGRLPAPRRETVTSYGYTRSSPARVARPRDVAQLREALALARREGRSVAVAGGRNSFGDVFQLREQLVVDLSGLDRILDFDRERGVLVAQAGARVPAILARIMPEGWILRGLSGSLWNTVGGNLAANVHGKDAWREGSFVRNVRSFRLLCADGEEREVDRASDPELFAAVPGGLGLLGLVTELTLELRPIPSLRVAPRSLRVRDLDEMLAAFRGLDGGDEAFAYGWLDAFATGPALGRGVFATARFAPGPDPADPATLLAGLTPRRRVAFLRPESFWALYRLGWDVLVALHGERLFHRAMNALKFAAARPDARRAAPVPFPAYQYPVVGRFSHWRDKFRPHGFHEVQALFPTDAAPEAFRALLGVCREHRITPEICSIRRHRADGTLLSFEGDGLSMTVNHPLKHLEAARRGAFTGRLLDAIVEHGGRVYLAKFPFLPPAIFRRMYPEHERFLAIKARVDPGRLFWSDAAERLFG